MKEHSVEEAVWEWKKRLLVKSILNCMSYVVMNMLNNLFELLE